MISSLFSSETLYTFWCSGSLEIVSVTLIRHVVAYEDNLTAKLTSGKSTVF
jgi:hypothetical protein